MLGGTLEKGRTCECPWAWQIKAVVGGNLRKREGHQNVHWQIWMMLGATFNKGKDTKMSIGR
jgi:hypothetical protein